MARLSSILTVNTGSTGVRLASFTIGPAGIVEGERTRMEDREPPESALEPFRSGPIDAVSHRVVHGGERLVQPCLLDAGTRAEIQRLSSLAPLHNPRALEWVDACERVFGTAIPQVAVFDTALYADLPEVARNFALPPDTGIRRYGFHGIAHGAMLRAWREAGGRGRAISLQLGGGCSITASMDARAIDTSMGFSPLEGLVMATRGGDLDPGAILHLLRSGMDVDALDELLNRRSGLAGMSGESDMRQLLARDDLPARHAVDLYCYRARKYVGAYLAALGGAEAILFGGGVGEHAPMVRERILQGLEWAGVRVDSERNRALTGQAGSFAAPASSIALRVVQVDEARVLAQEALELLQNGRNRS